MKQELICFFKKLSKVYDDGYVVKGIARNREAFQVKGKDGRSMYQMLEDMGAKGYASLSVIIRERYAKDNREARPFVLNGNFAIKFDDVVKYMVEMFQG